MIKPRQVAMVTFFLLVTSICTQASGQAVTDTELIGRRVGLQVSNASLLDVLNILAVEYRFAPEKGMNKFELRNRLADTPEVQDLLVANSTTVNRVSDYVYYPSVYSDVNINLAMSNTDVRGVLNRIVRDSEHKLWVVAHDEKRKTLALGF